MGPVLGRLTEWLGWKYLALRRVGETEGHFESEMAPPSGPAG
jgi:hypothetical protein